MARFLLMRLVQSVFTLFLVLAVVFVIARVAGDPVTLLVTFDASQADIDRLREELGLSDPLPQQFVRFMGDALRGDFGTSFRTNRPAMNEVLERVPASARLAGLSLAFSLAISLPLGVLAAVSRGSVVDLFARFLALVGQAAPNFWLGLMLIFFFAVRLGWLPTGGRGGLDHMVLPAIALGTAGAASITRLTRSALLDVLNSDFVVMARAKGLPRRTVIFKHALRNALIPVVTILGLRIGTVISGSVIVETIFAWPGVGRLIIQAINVSDFPVVQAAVTLTASAVILANLLTDIAYMLVDPRIRYVRS
ncbi:MAG: ABC transporter permease [Chloroflexi bacterium]|nr:ABC transporter permease [Chloroflexota bacterium]MDA1003388.1 ABC transporter permease [Chloroflexota bacterium]